MKKHAVVLALLCGCANQWSELPYSVNLNTINPVMADEARSAMALWNETAHTTIFVETNGVGHVSILQTHECVLKSDELGHADWSPTHCKVCFRTDETYTVTETLTHELGHCLGIPHSSNPESIMFGGARPNQKLLPEDVKYFTEQL